MDKILISRDRAIMRGAPCFAGTRVLAKNLFDYLEVSSALWEFLEDLPSVSWAAAIDVFLAAKDRLLADAPAV